MRWTISELAEIVGGVAIGEADIDEIVVDSRSVTASSLFVALRGDRVDGHEFVGEGLGAGAAGAMVEPGRLPDGAVGVEVADTLEALGAIAVDWRSRLDLPVVAVTGSTGKTTTKDFLATLLGPGTHAAPKSFNNEVGVPLTVLSCRPDAGALVIEVGSRGLGHIESLSDMIRPDVSIITNIGPAHLEMFGDLATTRRAKAELMAALGDEGVAVLPHDDTELRDMWDGAVLTFGEDEGASVSIHDVVVDGLGRASCEIVCAGIEIHLDLKVAGRHQPRNAAAAVAASVALGRDFVESVERLSSVELSPWRMAVETRTITGGEVTVINDAYNANPTSMESALETVAVMPGRRFAVLGMMHELGEGSPSLHRQVGMRAAELGFRVVVVGEDPGIAEGAGDGTVRVSDVAAAASVLAKELMPGDVVVIKASRATGLETLPQLIGGNP